MSLKSFDSALGSDNWPKPKPPQIGFEQARSDGVVDLTDSARTKHFRLVRTLKYQFSNLPEDFLWRVHLESAGNGPQAKISILEDKISKIFRETIANELSDVFEKDKIDHVTELSLHGIRVSSKLVREILLAFPDIDAESIDIACKAAAKISKRLMRLTNESALAIESILGVYSKQSAFSVAQKTVDISEEASTAIETMSSQNKLDLGDHGCADFYFDVTNTFIRLIGQCLKLNS